MPLGKERGDSHQGPVYELQDTCVPAPKDVALSPLYDVGAAVDPQTAFATVKSSRL